MRQSEHDAALNLLAREVGINEPPAIRHRMNTVDTHAGFAGTRRYNNGNVAAAHAVARNAASAARAAPVPSRHVGDACQASGKPRLADKHLHAKRQRFDASFVGKLVNEPFDEKAVVAVGKAPPRPGWHRHAHGEMVNRQIGNGIWHLCTAQRQRIKFACGRLARCVNALAIDPVCKLTHAGCCRHPHAHGGHCAFGIYRGG